MSVLSRRLAAIVTGTLIAFFAMPGVAQAAGVGLAPYFIEYGSGMSTYVGKSGTTTIPIGVMTWGKGTAKSVKLTADLSGITNKVDIIAVSSPCKRSGSKVTCNFGTRKIKGQKKIAASLSLRAKARAPIGRAGTVRLTLTASPRPSTSKVSGKVDVRPEVADLVMTSTVPVARIGQTVTISHKVVNRGPSKEPWVSLSGDVQPGTKFVGGVGCTTTSRTFNCDFSNLAVGQSRVVSVKVKVTGCDKSRGTSGGGTGWVIALPDPNIYNNNLSARVRVVGCPGPTGA
ncbi:DUF11 domain-containing protein [Micromonospora eburnea]|uniref:DUF11 domain-containing protein n=1 Tax=Micromonospora eburnea TaxID=227316 RepID=A0A1C6TS59_9ACTN|nr:DUF11 domain-containing protein [Micromonospora eburnea]SCL44644.1 hypothetical protein GA0070604_0513 [Micromonospora eburnea]